MKVSVIIVNYNVKYFLEVCLNSVVRALEGVESEVIVVDNNSQDGSVEFLKQKFPTISLIANKDNRGFSRANNQAVDIAKGEYILFLNPDTVIPEDFFSKTLTYMDAHPEAGGIGPRLIDGKGEFAPDAKKSFPTLSVALFKATGINKLFPKSPYFNKYYAVDVGEYQVSPVESLSGCCMLMRAKAIAAAGGAFDEDYFMYFEDGDLCYRIRKAGYTNIYFPETTVIHYKGESTRKTTLSYVKIFNEAFAIFARKHYGKQNAKAFIFFINIGVFLRAILSIIKRVLKVLKMPLFDALVLLLLLWTIKNFWTEQVKEITPIPWRSIYLTFPAYIVIWIVSMFLNGAYDQPYRGLRVVRGMLIGTILCLAYFGLLSPELRHSRAIIIFTGAAGAIALVGLHELLYRLGILKLIPYDAVPRKAVIVAEETEYHKTAEILKKVHYAPDIYGRIGTHPNVSEYTALTDITKIKHLLYTAGIDEVIFCVNGLGFKQILKQMEQCGNHYEYKIHLQGSPSFIGSNSSHTAGDLYTIDKRFNLSRFSQQRNKRVVDIASALLLLLFSPVALFTVKEPGTFVSNCIKVLLARRTWVGYERTTPEQTYLPPLKQSILPPYNISADFEPSKEVKAQLNIVYAENYSPAQDINFILKNFTYLGRKSEKDFAEI
jgi:O-antigen biosynthesis protein